VGVQNDPGTYRTHRNPSMLSCATKTCYMLSLLDPSRAMHRLPAAITHQLLLRNMEQVVK
jgi:hypothetical protein